ncbi:hypothetical protein A0H81_01602 [Grifola frondosa]|uniref:Glycoside hydrolase family 3 N-terminal domain-containing protein n=1 Tax=Grifola frondosa TaxID=5627 RepID=A0A1C7MPT7_GRIFR|nr:hypothetical protein A0H81_01602 [Grifola frondosa]
MPSAIPIKCVSIRHLDSNREKSRKFKKADVFLQSAFRQSLFHETTSCKASASDSWRHWDTAIPIAFTLTSTDTNLLTLEIAVAFSGLRIKETTDQVPGGPEIPEHSSLQSSERGQETLLECPTLSVPAVDAGARLREVNDHIDSARNVTPSPPRWVEKFDKSRGYMDIIVQMVESVAELHPIAKIAVKALTMIYDDTREYEWLDDFNDPLDDTKTFNQTGLEAMMRQKGGSIWVTIGQRYLMENTTLGIPALIQSEGLRGFTNNGTTWPSPIGLAASFNPTLPTQVAATIATEAEGLGVSQIFAPVLDLSRELRWGRVEEIFEPGKWDMHTSPD